VLAYVAYALPPLNREERATRAKVAIKAYFNGKQQAFLDFVLAQYVQVGVEELDQEKLTPLLRLKYHNSISDALADLGRAEDILGWPSLAFRSTSISIRRASEKSDVNILGSIRFRQQESDNSHNLIGNGCPESGHDLPGAC
jgi:hypothetical protein